MTYLCFTPSPSLYLSLSWGTICANVLIFYDLCASLSLCLYAYKYICMQGTLCHELVTFFFYSVLGDPLNMKEKFNISAALSVKPSPCILPPLRK